MTAPDPRLDEIQARLDAATPGPWKLFGTLAQWESEEDISFGPDDAPEVGTVSEGLGDADFIANAPADVAFLLAELRKAHEARQYALDIVAEGYPRHVGPFPTRAAAERWMEGRKLTGSWNVYPMIRAAVAAAKGDERG